MPKNKLNKIRNGKQFMRADEIWRISRALNVSSDYLLDDEQKDKPNRIQPLSDIDVSLPWHDNPSGKTDGRNKPKIRKSKDAPLS